MEQTLTAEFLRVAEQAAIACARSIGHGKRKYSDQLAVEAMRHAMETIQMDGTIVIGEGERDEAPMLYVGEKVGMGMGFPAIDIAVDPLEGTNLCATGAPNAIAVLAASEKGGLLHAPDLYMEKLVVGPPAKGRVSLEATVGDNLHEIAKALSRKVQELTVVVLDRPRHEKLVADIRQAGARIQLIGDGDLSAAISAAVSGTGVHAVMGIGGAPEGVLSAAALKCLNGEIQGRLLVDTNTASREKAEDMGVDFGRIYKTEDLAPGEHIIFAACGVTSGNLLKGVRFFGDGVRTSSLILNYSPRRVRFIETVHIEPGEDVWVRF
ncbi:MAG: D-fructose 1,6-bisphosphatase class 2/sedoheptulose 1,7-bisphosphatase [Acidobacteria bacterium ADurb.Bin340]|nr:MAG: D-fructose 1,6-bisphosphatase class 2/sedoheptulose 1,7-bisphosphatase [Acidobacteria bacterium ADurb.Bin340]HOD32388.1 class II fructose-bisphosphatase [Holophaga sp.]HQL48072.1 class II fructose-bisphosphatase [Holophaga sp.]